MLNWKLQAKAVVEVDDDLNELEALNELLNVPPSTQTPPPVDRVASRVAEPTPATPTSVPPSCPESSGIDRLFSS